MPTEASSRAGLTISGNGSATRDTSGAVNTTASGVGTPAPRSTSLARCLCTQSPSVSGDDPV